MTWENQVIANGGKCQDETLQINCIKPPCGAMKLRQCYDKNGVLVSSNPIPTEEPKPNKTSNKTSDVNSFINNNKVLLYGLLGIAVIYLLTKNN